MMLTIIAWFLPPSLIVAAATATGNGDPLTWLINFGTLGVVFVLLMAGYLHTGSEVDGLRKRIELQDKAIERKDGVIAAFQAQLTGNTLPAMAQSARVLEAIPNSETALRDELRRTRRDMVDLVSQMRDLSGGDK